MDSNVFLVAFAIFRGTWSFNNTTTSPRPLERWRGKPRFLTSMVSPEFEFAGTLMTRDLPSMWSRVTVVPRTKSEYPKGRDMIKSEPERSNHGCGSISNSMNKSPGSPWPCGAGSPRPLMRRRVPDSAPSGTLNRSVFDFISWPCPSQTSQAFSDTRPWPEQALQG